MPQGVLGEVCRSLGVRVANWNPAYRTSCFIFSHGDTYHHTLMAEPTEAWEDMPWTPEMEAADLAYLKSRWSGTRDWIWFHDEPDEDFAAYAREVGLDLNKPIVGLLDQRHVGRPAPLPGQRLPEHAGLGAPDDRVLQGPARPPAADPRPPGRDPGHRAVAPAAGPGDREGVPDAAAERLRHPAGVAGLHLRRRGDVQRRRSSTAPRPASS